MLPEKKKVEEEAEEERQGKLNNLVGFKKGGQFLEDICWSVWRYSSLYSLLDDTWGSPSLTVFASFFLVSVTWC